MVTFAFGMVVYHSRTRPIALAIGEAGELPTEFRLFVRGVNSSEKGSVLFDAKAAAMVMAAYQTWGVDLAIDLEHQMLDLSTADPTSRDARGWAKLELRDDGSLWAVQVTWTPDGAERLSQKRQRYVSPAFLVDPKTKRVTKVINIALTSVPATHNTPALVAASLNGAGMDPKDITEALDALIAGDAEKCAELLKRLIAGESAEDTPGAAEGGTPEGLSETPSEPSDEEKKTEQVAASMLMKLSGRPTLAEALSEVAVWRASHIELEKNSAKLAEERAVFESAERKRLCAELIKLGAEFPATVWADDKGTTLKARWSKMQIDELKATVVEQRSARGKGKTQESGAKGKESDSSGSRTFDTPHGPMTLSATEISAAVNAGAKPEVYAANKAFLTKR